MTKRMALILETTSGNTYVVICNSRAAADRIRDVSKDKCVGIVPIYSRVDALIPDVEYAE